MCGQMPPNRTNLKILEIVGDILGSGIVYLCWEITWHRDEIPPGSLHVPILRARARDAKLHGFEIADSTERASKDVLRI